MPYQYQRTPFNTSQPVQMYTGCHGFVSGAKDIGLDFHKIFQSLKGVNN